MGGAATKIDTKYEKDRSQLRRALILSFIDNAENRDIVNQIESLKSLVTKHPHLCATAARELARVFDCSPTSLDAAYAELDRLYTIYETSTVLKSVQCRIGPVACPLGHYALFFEVLNAHPIVSAEALCGICDASVSSGYHCSFCAYNLCVPCSTVYCENGHAMKLWTHPESQYFCALCGENPITSGYHCPICEDYDICDLCTSKDGRGVVEKKILDRMVDDLQYMTDHQEESVTAKRTIIQHHNKMESRAYPTILELHKFSLTTADVRMVCVAEVRQTQIMNDCIRLRTLLSQDDDICATARREKERLLKGGNFTAEEVERLKLLVDTSDLARSAVVRNKAIVACPLGHAALHYNGRPIQYLKRDRYIETKGSPPFCVVCERAAAPECYHCDFCEYDMCSTCSVVYCAEAHPTVMWTVPDACAITCDRCGVENLTAGYHCNTCNVDICDRCTRREERLKIRRIWETELGQLLKYMRDNRDLSDIAMYYNWRFNNYIVSVGLLADYKEIIDQIKSIRRQLMKDVTYSAISRREAQKNSLLDYIFPNKKKAKAELQRLASIVEQGWRLQAAEKRSAAGIACPLGHAMEPAIVTIDMEDDLTERSSATNKEVRFIAVLNTDDLKDQPLSLPASPETRGSRELVPADFADVEAERPLFCQTCGNHKPSEFRGGFRCHMCEYDLCKHCSAVYCRYGHQMKIWTLAEAICSSCDLCKKEGITSGYRCLECNVDVCDSCTAKDGRNAFMQYPQRDIDRILTSLDAMRDQSEIADNYLKKQEKEHQNMRRAFTMSRLAIVESKVEMMEQPDGEGGDGEGSPLHVPHAFLLLKKKQLELVLAAAESDLQARKAKIRAKKYGQKAFDL
eukprot:gene24938-33433_t